MPGDDPKLSLDEELARKRGLERDLITEILTSRTRAWRYGSAGIMLAILACGALATALPLKPPPELYAVRVNDATGDVTNVSMLRDAQEDYGERIARYFIHQYVLSCESYDWNTIQNTYERCGLFSSPEVQREYRAKFEGDKALDKRYANHTRVRVNVRSITLGPKQSAVVRFTRRTEGGNQPVQSEQLIATLAYHYVNTPLSEAIGRENPLGFQVVSYATDIETER